MEYCRLQLGCLLIVGYIGFIYFRECRRYHKKLSSSMFNIILIVSMVCILFDAITAVTVNYPESVHPVWNKGLHLVFHRDRRRGIYDVRIYAPDDRCASRKS